MSKIILVSFIFIFTLCQVLLKSLFRESNLIAQRLVKYTSTPAQEKEQEEDQLNRPFSERVIQPILTSLASLVTRFTPGKNREKLEQALQYAGRPGNLTAQEFQALHYLSIIIIASITWSLGLLARKNFSDQLLLAVQGGFATYLFGKVFISSRARKRKMILQKELPDVLDLLTVSVEAGLGFDAALMHVISKSKGQLSQEFRTTLQELQMGKSRREALRDLGSRTGVDDILTFVGSMIQADQLGVPVTKILRTQSQQVRMKRRQRVEEKAMKAPIKMLLPLVFFIFPSIFIVLLGPAAMKIYELLVKGM